MVEKKVFERVEHQIEGDFARADLEIYGINHFRPSFTVRVFFNDPEVTEEDCREDRPSFAGRFSVFGHAECAGDDDHCHAPTAYRRFDDRPTHPLTRAFRRVVVTDALKAALAGAEDETVTITLVAGTAGDDEVEGPLMDFEGMSLTTFR